MPPKNPNVEVYQASSCAERQAFHLRRQTDRAIQLGESFAEECRIFDRSLVATGGEKPLLSVRADETADENDDHVGCLFRVPKVMLCRADLTPRIGKWFGKRRLGKRQRAVDGDLALPVSAAHRHADS